MNRKERRAAKKEPEVTREMVERAVKKVTQQEELESLRKAFLCLMWVVLMVLRDKYGFGRKRLEEFAVRSVDLFDSVNKEYCSVPDMKDTIFEETGLILEEQKNALNVCRAESNKLYLKAVNNSKEIRKSVCERMCEAMEWSGAEVSDVRKVYDEVLFVSDKNADERVEDVRKKTQQVNLFDVIVWAKACNVSADWLLGLSERK